MILTVRCHVGADPGDEVGAAHADANRAVARSSTFQLAFGNNTQWHRKFNDAHWLVTPTALRQPPAMVTLSSPPAAAVDSTLCPAEGTSTVSSDMPAP